MEYAIYTFGGGEILWKILNGIAILFKGDTPYFSMIAGLVASSSLVFVGASALFRGAPMYFLQHWFFPVILVTNILFGITAKVNIIDVVDGNQRFSQVANVPLGLAAVGSLTTTVSKHVTEAVEQAFGSVDGTPRYTSTGLMFGSRLASMAKSIRIKDPILQENLKAYVSRCFMWPYVFTNISPGKKAALESEDILAFIEANPHPSLGVYWRESDGSSSFKKCSECTATVKNVIALEVDHGLRTLAGKVFGKSPEDGSTKTCLLQYFGNGWEQITNKTQTAATIVQQELLINSYKQAFEDHRDQLGLGRVDGDLLTLNASRAQAQQNIGMLIKGAMADIDVPAFHSGLLGLSMMLFVVIGPIALLPKGLTIFFTWLKVMACLATWPILYAILECLGQMYAQSAMATSLVGYGAGLSILTQNAMSDTAYSCYSWIQSMQLAIPPLSWALVSGGGYAMSQLAGSFTQGVEAGASKASVEMTDGNTSFGSQTLHHKSIANTSVAQQQLAPNIGYGMRVDNGQFSKIMGTDGSEIYHQHQHQLASNLSTNNTFSQMASMQGQERLETAISMGRASTTAYNDGMSKIASVMNSVSRNNTLASTDGSAESVNAQESMNKAMDIVKQISESNDISAERALLIAHKAGVSAGFTMGVIPNVNVSAGMDITSNFSGKEQEALRKFEQSGDARTFSENFNKGFQYLHDVKGSISDSSVHQGMDQAQASFSKAESYSEQSNLNFNNANSWQRMAASSEQNSVGATNNKNADILAYVAHKKFGGDIDMATEWQRSHQQDYIKMAQNYMEDRRAGLLTSTAGGNVTKDSIFRTYERNQDLITNRVSEGKVRDMNTQIDLRGNKTMIERDVRRIREATKINRIDLQKKVDNNGIKENYDRLDRKFERNVTKKTPEIAVEKMINENGKKALS
jgi:hypothetical protein